MEIVFVFLVKALMIVWCIIHFGAFFIGTIANYAMLSMVKEGKVPPESVIENVLWMYSRRGVKILNPKLAFLFLGSWLAWGVVVAAALYFCSIAAAAIFKNSSNPLAEELLIRGFKQKAEEGVLNV